MQPVFSFGIQKIHQLLAHGRYNFVGHPSIPSPQNTKICITGAQGPSGPALVLSPVSFSPVYQLQVSPYEYLWAGAGTHNPDQRVS